MDPKDLPNQEIFGDQYLYWLMDLIGARYEEAAKTNPELVEGEKHYDLEEIMNTQDEDQRLDDPRHNQAKDLNRRYE